MKYSPQFPIYMDCAATTPVSNEVLQVMRPTLNIDYGNPSAIYRLGQKSASHIRKSKSIIATILNCNPKSLIFTSGGTESNNLAIRGISFMQKFSGKGNHIVISAVEHPSVSKTVKHLSKYYGFEYSKVEVDDFGKIKLSHLEECIKKDTILVSCIFANHEVGTIQPIEDISKICMEAKVFIHTDAVQGAGSARLDIKKLGVDALSISGHKIYGPKGVGMLFLKQNTPFLTQMTGGEQEENLRAGTENVPGIVGLASALELIRKQKPCKESHRFLINKVLASIPDSKLTGHPEDRIELISSFVFKDIHAYDLLIRLDLEGIAASSGSSCTVGNQVPSEILLAMGYDDKWNNGALRLSFGSEMDKSSILYFVDKLSEIIAILRNQK